MIPLVVPTAAGERGRLQINYCSECFRVKPGQVTSQMATNGGAPYRQADPSPRLRQERSEPTSETRETTGILRPTRLARWWDRFTVEVHVIGNQVPVLTEGGIFQDMAPLSPIGACGVLEQQWNVVGLPARSR